MKEETKGRIISAVVPGEFLLLSKLGRWYEKNPYHKFKKGDILILRHRGILGYGIRPVAVVNNYGLKEDRFGQSGKYDITMYEDTSGNFLQWMRLNEFPKNVERIASEHEIHFKWNIENQFKKVHVSSIDEALVLYASREVGKQERAA